MFKDEKLDFSFFQKNLNLVQEELFWIGQIKEKSFYLSSAFFAMRFETFFNCSYLKRMEIRWKLKMGKILKLNKSSNI